MCVVGKRMCVVNLIVTRMVYRIVRSVKYKEVLVDAIVNVWSVYRKKSESVSVIQSLTFFPYLATAQLY